MCTDRYEGRKTGHTYSCRRCDQCRRQACNDIKGRLCAEHRTSMAKGWTGFLVTLTYGFDGAYYGEHRKNPRSQAFYWEDIRQWRKRLWKGGFPHRCYIVGECGDKLGRVHWHVIVWFTGFELGQHRDLLFIGPVRGACRLPPNIVLSDPKGPDYSQLGTLYGRKQDYRRYVHWLKEPEGFNRYAKVQRHWEDTSGGTPLWMHGWSTWQRLDDAHGGFDAIGYATAYLFKNGRVGDTGIGGRGYAGRKYYGGTTRGESGPLGADYFRTILAPIFINAGHSPQRPIYSFDEVRKRVKRQDGSRYGPDGKRLGGGEPYEFFLPPGATRRIFLDAFVRGWVEKYGHDDWPQSDMVDRHVEDMARRERREAGVPDIPEEQFIDRFYVLRHAKTGGWAKLNKLSAKDRERFRFIRSLQEAGFDIDVPEELAKMLGPGNKRVRQNE